MAILLCALILKAVSDVQFASIRPGKPEVHVKFLAIGENISSHPRTASRHQLLLYSHCSLSKLAETAKEFLVMVISNEGRALTGYPIGHVFTAFSSPISMAFASLVGAVQMKTGCMNIF